MSSLSDDSLSPAERLVLSRLLELAQDERALERKPTLDDLELRWERFVREVEAGYQLSIYDYSQDLSIRDTLEQVRKGLPESRLKKRLEVRLAPLDDRFRLATRSSDRPIAPGASPGERSWWFRIPRRLQGELKEDFAAEGFDL